MSEPASSAAPDDLISSDAGRKYWQGVDADENGMLGGIPACNGISMISKVDLQGSRTFLARLGIGTKNGRRAVATALEDGAGIGRVTDGLLLHVAEQVDVVEPVAKFTAQLQGEHGVRTVFNLGLEEWQPADGVQYDLIWTQWCLGHLTDQQLVRYLERCKTVLRPGSGVIVIKENLSTSGADVFDATDSSVTREEAKFQSLSAGGLAGGQDRTPAGISPHFFRDAAASADVRPEAFDLSIAPRHIPGPRTKTRKLAP